MSKKEKKLKLIPLGGMGEIGKNMTLLEYGEDIFVIDCGLAFPDDHMPGIDVVIPDMTYLEENREKLRGFVITHGHEDHIGAMPYALQKFDVPVYGTDLTVALIEHKLQEMHVPGNLNVVKPGDTVELGCFKVEFIKTSHSIPGAVALAISTPLGVILHTGDFKIDLTPLDGQPIDINRLAYYGSKGVLCLLSDSTNVERAGYTQSEKEIGKTFEHYFDIAKGRVIVASFASNVYRIQQVADVAIEHDRVICFAGKSMEQIVAYSRNLGYLNIPQDRIVKVDDLKSYHDEKVCIITTGSQGEPMSGLYRMANASHKINIGFGDTVIISASAIPGLRPHGGCPRVRPRLPGGAQAHAPHRQAQILHPRPRRVPAPHDPRPFGSRHGRARGEHLRHEHRRCGHLHEAGRGQGRGGALRGRHGGRQREHRGRGHPRPAGPFEPGPGGGGHHRG